MIAELGELVITEVRNLASPTPKRIHRSLAIEAFEELDATLSDARRYARAHPRSIDAIALIGASS